jgi:hypothetical protein
MLYQVHLAMSGVVCVAHLYFGLCLRPVSFVPIVARVSELSVLDLPFGFL